MLRLKNKPAFQFPTLGSKTPELSPVPVGRDDELLDAIERDASGREQWDLYERPDEGWLDRALADTALSELVD